MEKQLIALGPTKRKSYVVTLPIDWVRKYELDKQRKVDTEIVNDTVIIKPFQREKTTVSLNAKEVPKSLLRILQLEYKRGTDKIIVTSASAQIINKISEFIETRCIGFEIIEQNKEKCVIKDVAKQSSEDFHTLINRSFFIVKQLALEKDEQTIKNLDKNLNKITNYCQRLLLKEYHAEFKNIIAHIQLAHELESIGDELKYAHLNKQQISEETKELFEKIHVLHQTFSYKLFDLLNEKIRIITGKNYYETIILRRINRILGIIYSAQIK